MVRCKNNVLLIVVVVESFVFVRRESSIPNLKTLSR